MTSYRSSIGRLGGLSAGIEPRRPALWSVYLALCIVLGGASAAGAMANWVLQVAAIIVLAREFLIGAPDRRPLPKALRAALMVLTAIAILQLLPLPAAWFNGSIRGIVRAILTTISANPSWSSLSTTPLNSIACLLSLLPAIAMAVLFGRSIKEPEPLPVIVLGLAFVSILLGAAQLATGGDSPFYLYTITNHGSPVGFFSNRNHFATFVLMVVPVAAYMSRKQDGDSRTQARARLIGLAGIAAIIFIVMMLIGSDTGILLSFPIIGASFLLYHNVRVPPIVTTVTVAVLTTGLGLTTVYGASFIAYLRPDGVPQLDRTFIWDKTLKMIITSFPFGTGLGSFATAFANLEDPMTVTPIFVNHAHNDYLEIASELGLLGVALIITFLSWWIRQAVKIWKSADTLAKLGVVMSAIVLLHSAVDYPARTAAIMALFAAAIALMIRHNLNDAPVVNH